MGKLKFLKSIDIVSEKVYYSDVSRENLLPFFQFIPKGILCMQDALFNVHCHPEEDCQQEMTREKISLHGFLNIST